jgi:hypothetical protein
VSTVEELLDRKSSGSVLKETDITAVGICYADHTTDTIRKFGTNFSDKWRSFGGIVLSRTKATEFVFVCNNETAMIRSPEPRSTHPIVHSF